MPPENEPTTPDPSTVTGEDVLAAQRAGDGFQLAGLEGVEAEDFADCVGDVSAFGVGDGDGGF